MEVVSSFQRPTQVLQCHQAVLRDDFEGVQQQVRQLLHDPAMLWRGQKPHPGWLYDSLSEAIRMNNVDITRYLLDYGVASGDFPSEAAVRARAFDVLDLFLQRGWNINSPLSSNEPPVLGIAISTSDIEMTAWLLEHGADPNGRCDLDLTPTSYAMHESLAMIEKLFSHGATVRHGQLLHHATLRNKPDSYVLIRWLVEKGAPVDEIKYETDPISYMHRAPFGLGTPLHRAAESGQIEVVKYLLSKGANPAKVDSKGCTPRFWAAERGHIEVADILLAAEYRPF